MNTPGYLLPDDISDETAALCDVLHDLATAYDSTTIWLISCATGSGSNRCRLRSVPGDRHRLICNSFLSRANKEVCSS
jgi:hypothetical protein